jgi:hypothetical protein
METLASYSRWPCTSRLPPTKFAYVSRDYSDPNRFHFILGSNNLQTEDKRGLTPSVTLWNIYVQCAIWYWCIIFFCRSKDWSSVPFSSLTELFHSQAVLGYICHAAYLGYIAGSVPDHRNQMSHTNFFVCTVL